jgi:hypothetical protein
MASIFRLTYLGKTTSIDIFILVITLPLVSLKLSLNYVGVHLWVENIQIYVNYTNKFI